jgi:hypothetical protein
MLTLKNFPPAFSLFAVVMSVLIGACSDGGGGGYQNAGGGTGGTGISAGSVTGFGSIFVNGVEFNTDNATYIRNGISSVRPSTTPDANYIFKLGMNAEVQGEITSPTTGTANTVKIIEAVRGKLLSAPTGSASAGTMTVLGQVVHVDDTTLYDASSLGTGFAALAASANQVLEIHGKRNFDGSILASYIEKSPSATTFSTRGTISSHNFSTHTFSIGSLVVDYTGNTSVFGNMPTPTNANNWNGLYVYVAGAASGCSSNPCGTFIASTVEPVGLSLSTAIQAELEGLVTGSPASNAFSGLDFTLDFQQVQTTSSTIYSGGIQADIVAGSKLEVEGTLTAGVISATKVRFKDNVLIDANVTAAISGSTLTLDGLPGVTVTANIFTDLPSLTTPSNLATNLAGHSVRIRGRANPGVAGGVIATRIQDHGLANSTGNMSLTAFVPKNPTLTGPTFTMLGVTIDTSAPAPTFTSDQGAGISSATFFATLKNGAMVTAIHQMSDPLVSNSAFLPGALKEVQLGDSQN